MSEREPSSSFSQTVESVKETVVEYIDAARERVNSLLDAANERLRNIRG
jgi:hypothetical protein